MALVELVFRQGPASGPPTHLVFGESEVPVDVGWSVAAALPNPPTFAAVLFPQADLYLTATLPSLKPNVLVGPVELVSLTAVLPYPTLTGVVGPPVLATFAATLPQTLTTFDAEFSVDHYTDRPVAAPVTSLHQVAVVVAPQGTDERSQTPRGAPAGYDTAWGLAQMGPRGGAREPSQDAARLRTLPEIARHSLAAPLRMADLGVPQQDGLRDRRFSTRSSYEQAIDVRAKSGDGWQDMLRHARERTASRWTGARAFRRPMSQGARSAIPLHIYRDSLFRFAIRPPGGVRYVPPIDPGEVCYDASNHLVFSLPWRNSGHVVFICDYYTPPAPPPTATVVVPIRAVYMSINEVTLRRLPAGPYLHPLSFDLTIDAESWTMSWTATLPGSDQANVEPSGSEPVELEVSINGTVYRLVAERLSRDRQFGSSRLRVSGRGRNAILSAPYAVTRTFTNPFGRTAQQLMEDVLTDNGVPIGWDVDFRLEDWFVPADVFAHQGTYQTALAAIAGAAGGYLQPHRTNATVRVLPRYPAAPWEWGSATPDYELPAAIATTESIEWVDKPAYNRVYVAGQREGILGCVTRAGTAGELVAPMVTDQLITEVDAARQRGISILGDTGRQAAVTLALPVLPETGIIEPGSMVRYTDGGTTRLGLVRSLNVRAAMPQVRQTIGVETHVAA